MKCWVFAFNPLERYMAHYEQIFDAWEDGGVRGIIVGRVRFIQPDGSVSRAYAPDPQVYRSFGVSPPAPEPHDARKQKVLNRILDDAASRNWHIMFFGQPGGGGGRPHEEDPFGEIRFAANAQEWERRAPFGRAYLAEPNLDRRIPVLVPFDRPIESEV